MDIFTSSSVFWMLIGIGSLSILTYFIGVWHWLQIINSGKSFKFERERDTYSSSKKGKIVICDSPKHDLVIKFEDYNHSVNKTVIETPMYNPVYGILSIAVYFIVYAVIVFFFAASLHLIFNVSLFFSLVFFPVIAVPIYQLGKYLHRKRLEQYTVKEKLQGSGKKGRKK